MFREMRRSKQQLPREVAVEILERNTSGVLALSGDEGYPYAVPMSYVYAEGKIYFHSAKNGHKIDAIQRNEKASFCVIDQDQIIPEKYTTFLEVRLSLDGCVWWRIWRKCGALQRHWP